MIEHALVHCIVFIYQEEDDESIQRQATDIVQSEEELMQSGASGMQDSVEPPMIHYADDENDDVNEMLY